MIAYKLVNWVYTGASIDVGGIAPAGHTFVPPIDCADDEVVMLIAGAAVVVKKSSLQQPGGNNDLDIDTVRANKIQEMESRRATLESAGCPFIFGEVGDIVQTRDERDFININGVVTNAMLLKSAGITDPVVLFRAQSDINYQLTPDSAIALGVAVAMRSVNLYSIKWQLKDAVHAAQTANEINAIQWPEN